MREFATIFLALVFETTPFLLAGVLVSVVGGPWIERTLERAAFRSPILGAVAGASAGIALPMCDCGSRPLAHRLALAGRREFALAFLVAAPVVNPIVIMTTWLAFRDPTLLVLRLAVTLVMAFTVSLVLSQLRGDIAVQVAAGRHSDEPANGGWLSVPPRVLEEFVELFQFLVVGSALAAAIQVFVRGSALAQTGGLLLPIGAMMGLAFLLSICSSVDAFVVAGLGSGLGLGPILAFLTVGPLMNLKSMPIYFRLFSLP